MQALISKNLCVDSPENYTHSCTVYINDAPLRKPFCVIPRSFPRFFWSDFQKMPICLWHYTKLSQFSSLSRSYTAFGFPRSSCVRFLQCFRPQYSWTGLSVVFTDAAVRFCVLVQRKFLSPVLFAKLQCALCICQDNPVSPDLFAEGILTYLLRESWPIRWGYPHLFTETIFTYSLRQP